MSVSLLRTEYELRQSASPLAQKIEYHLRRTRQSNSYIDTAIQIADDLESEWPDRAEANRRLHEAWRQVEEVSLDFAHYRLFGKLKSRGTKKN